MHDINIDDIRYARKLATNTWWRYQWVRYLDTLDDIVAESFLCLVVSAKKYDGRGEFKSFYKCSLEYHLQYLRQTAMAKKRQHVPGPMPYDIHDDRCNFENDITNKIFIDTIMSDDRLTQPRRDYLRSYLDGVHHAETARAHNVSQSAVYQAHKTVVKQIQRLYL